MINKKVIVRADRTGVFYGTLKSKEGSEVILTDCRRIYYWDGACSISELAKTGTKKPENCKFTVTVDDICVLGVIEIIPCTEEAAKSIGSVKVWKF